MANKEKLTAGRIRDFACFAVDPTTGKKISQAFLWDTDTKGLAVRAIPPGVKSPTGKKSFIYQGRFGSEVVRITIGDVSTYDIPEARRRAAELAAMIDRGLDPRVVKAEIVAEQVAKAKVDEAGAVTFGDALRDYVEKKRRTKDGLPLKARTKDDYLSFIASGRRKADGTDTKDGALFPIAEIPLARLTADDIRKVHADMLARKDGGANRQAAYCAQVLRAVLNWHGVKIEGNPLGKDVAGRDRIAIPPSKADARPIPAEKIGAWWRAWDDAANAVARDYFKFLVLTGARTSEPKALTVANCDLVAGRVILKDTKNRGDHVIYLSRQAREIVERNVEGKQPDQPLFTLWDGKRTIADVVKRSGVTWRAKDLRSTFLNIAEQLVTGYTMKAMGNHANSADVTQTHYLRSRESVLREGWQAVADYIEQQAHTAPPVATGNVVPLRAA
jgi:integrase